MSVYCTSHTSIDRIVKEVENRLPAEFAQLGQMFRQCYPNTLETTTELLDDGTTFVFTGDIPAMWLRDSSAQVRPYLNLAGTDPEIQRLVYGLIQRQAQYILIDAYANAFNKEPNGAGHQTDITEHNPWVWERKFELDSLCYPIQLCHDYWQASGKRDIFTEQVHQMFRRVVEVMQIEQRHDTASTYSFERPPEYQYAPTDTLPLAGRGTRTNYTGMVWSGFRPSDDACKFGYLVPANMFAAVVLDYLTDFALNIYEDLELAETARKLREEIIFGINTYGIVNHPRYGHIYAYEADGYGNYNLMDDSNVPGLLSMPYFGYCADTDQLYRNTRAFVLSKDNPSYFEGKFAKGLGSPHTPFGYIWPMGLILQGLTATERSEQTEIIKMLMQTTAGTNFMHESFDPNDPTNFTRPWFAWANSLFGQFIYNWVMQA